MKSKKVGVWCCGNQPELYAALAKNGIDPNNPKDVTIFNQPFDMNAFLSKQIDAVQVLFISGYDQEALVDSEAQFLQKPFSRDDLTRSVRALLDSTDRKRRPAAA